MDTSIQSVGSADYTISRSAVFRWAVVILLANQLLRIIKESPTTLLDTITGLLSVNVFQCMAWYAVFRLLGASERTRIAPNRDWVVGLGSCMMVFIPTHGGSVWIAATMIGGYLILTPAGDRKLRSAGIVLLTLSVQGYWGSLLFEVIASPLLRAETAIVGSILQTMQSGTSWQDNIITAKSGWGIAIYPYCSSFHNVSLALLCWMTISRLASDIWRGRDYAVAGLIAVVMISMNMTRLALMSVNENFYYYWHDGTGKSIFAIAASLFVLLVSLFAVWRGKRA